LKAVILAGGMGTRISEETVVRPKPMVEIGGMPIIWHIMKYLSCYEIDEFIVCSGYKSSIIKDFFLNLRYYQSDLTINCNDGTVSVQDNDGDNWKVTIIDSGMDVATGGRILSAKKYLLNESFLLTYGDGVSNVNVDLLVKEHNQRGNLATVTAVKPKGRYGHLFVQDHKVESFIEKKPESETWINGGFFILEPECLTYIDDIYTPWEQGPMQKLAEEGELNAYLHTGFWQSMDTLRERNYLEEIWNSGQAPWKIWK
jgi:glucose-1-phosphate cytidylyltransferase